LTARERFLAVMRFEPDVRAPKAEFGYWTTALKRFVREGLPVVEPLPPDLPDNGTVSGAEQVWPGDGVVIERNVRACLGLEPYPAKFPIDVSARLAEKVLEESEQYKVYTDRYGITMKVYKKGTTPPLDLAFPIAGRADFERYKEHYPAADLIRRFPADWETVARRLRARDFPIRLGGFPFGFFGLPRHLIGSDRLYLLMYDDPRLILDLNEFFLGFVMEYWDKIIPAIRPDCVLIWEDMAGKTGSLISPEMFEQFLAPFYRRLIDFFRQHRVENILVDSDGYIEKLIPLWWKLGVTGLFPIERQAGNDPRAIRRAFPRLQLLGAVDKRVFAAGKSQADIDAELDLIAELLRAGGFVPHADHHVPDDSSWPNFRYYRKGLNRRIDAAGKV
jgi:uroporphyrinogen decarboxylase